jgi:hypothetical protein
MALTVSYKPRGMRKTTISKEELYHSCIIDTINKDFPRGKTKNEYINIESLIVLLVHLTFTAKGLFRLLNVYILCGSRLLSPLGFY